MDTRKAVISSGAGSDGLASYHTVEYTSTLVFCISQFLLSKWACLACLWFSFPLLLLHEREIRQGDIQCFGYLPQPLTKSLPTALKGGLQPWYNRFFFFLFDFLLSSYQVHPEAPLPVTGSRPLILSPAVWCLRATLLVSWSSCPPPTCRKRLGVFFLRRRLDRCQTAWALLAPTAE